jgi:hypothetical protein
MYIYGHPVHFKFYNSISMVISISFSPFYLKQNKLYKDKKSEYRSLFYKLKFKVL